VGLHSFIARPIHFGVCGFVIGGAVGQGLAVPDAAFPGEAVPGCAVVVPGVLEFAGGCDPGVTLVELDAVPLVPGVTHGLTVVPGAAPGVAVAFGVGETVDGVGDAVCGIGEAVCGVGVAVPPGACVLGEVVTAVPGFEFGVVLVPGFCPAFVLLELAVPDEVCPDEDGVAVCATSVELCFAAVGPVFEAPQWSATLVTPLTLKTFDAPLEP